MSTVLAPTFAGLTEMVVAFRALRQPPPFRKILPTPLRGQGSHPRGGGVSIYARPEGPTPNRQLCRPQKLTHFRWPKNSNILLKFIIKNTIYHCICRITVCNLKFFFFCLIFGKSTRDRQQNIFTTFSLEFLIMSKDMLPKRS